MPHESLYRRVEIPIESQVGLTLINTSVLYLLGVKEKRTIQKLHMVSGVTVFPRRII